jgi:hypothetical protein
MGWTQSERREALLRREENVTRLSVSCAREVLRRRKAKSIRMRSQM